MALDLGRPSGDGRAKTAKIAPAKLILLRLWTSNVEAPF